MIIINVPLLDYWRIIIPIGTDAILTLRYDPTSFLSCVAYHSECIFSNQMFIDVKIQFKNQISKILDWSHENCDFTNISGSGQGIFARSLNFEDWFLHAAVIWGDDVHIFLFRLVWFRSLCDCDCLGVLKKHFSAALKITHIWRALQMWVIFKAIDQWFSRWFVCSGPRKSFNHARRKIQLSYSSPKSLLVRRNLLSKFKLRTKIACPGAFLD